MADTGKKRGNRPGPKSGHTPGRPSRAKARTKKPGRSAGIGPANRKPSPEGEVLFGFHSVYEALKAGRRRFEQIWVLDRRTDPRVEKISALAAENKVPVRAATHEDLDRMAQGGTHQGIVARVSAFPVEDLTRLWPVIRNQAHPFFILMVESVEDPHNLGR